MGLTLATMLGQIGLPGGGFGHGYGSSNEPGLPPLRFGLPLSAPTFLRFSVIPLRFFLI
jgi:anaerobic selenocysteine-containing dehydrogenase